MNLDKLMMKREQFPVRIGKTGRRYGFKRISMPPYHPSMKEDGIDVDLALSVVDEALENTVLDLEDVAEKKPDAQSILDEIKRNQNGKIQYGEIKKEGLGRIIDPFPFIGHLYIGPRKINPYGELGDNFISLAEHKGSSSFLVPLDVKFTPELMEEYQMKEYPGYLFNQILCPNKWKTHNLDTMQQIFFKNFIIAINNEVVKRKYGGIK
jgi:hypothetical protein